VDKANGIDRTAKIAYDKAGNITKVTRQGRGCEIIDQEGNSETFRYDREGRMILHTDRNGNQVKTTYNMDSNPVLETRSDRDGNRTETRCWEYNSLGQTVKSIAGSFYYTYEYRPAGKLLRKAASGRTLVCCTYHADRRLKTLTDESGKTVAYGYEWKGNLAGITDEKGGRIATYSHYPDGKLKDIRHFNGVSSHYEYDTE